MHDALSAHTMAFMVFSREREMLQNAVLGSEACRGEGS